jgi:chromosome segregation ATPase
MIKKLGFVKISEHLKEIEKREQLCNVKLNELRDTISYREREIVKLQTEIAKLKNKLYIHKENNIKLLKENRYLKGALEKINNPLKDISIIASMELGNESKKND